MTYAFARPVAAGLAALTVAFGLGVSAAAAQTVNIYSYRQPDLIKPVLDAFTQETGIKTEVLFLDKGLEERIAAEGVNSPADVILTVDIARLQKTVDAGVTQPLNDATVNANIPAEYRDPAGNWFGLTKRARVVYASAERVGDEPITYESLADPKWKGKICIRSGQHDYNLALISAAIAHWGEAKAEAWVKGLKANLARKPDGGDRDQAKAIAAGECDIALGNTYYVGLMMTNEKDPEQKDWAKAIKVVFPTFENGGTHVNVSGLALAKNAPNKANAVKFMEFMVSDDSQRIHAEANSEYPIKAGIKIHPTIASFGELKADNVAIAEIAKLRKKASELVDKVGFDQ